MTKILAILLALVSGCAGALGDEAHEPVQDAFVLSIVAPELEAPAREWAARWSAATGIPITVGTDGGAPVDFADSLHDVDPTYTGNDCGQTQETFYGKAELAEHRYSVDSILLLANADPASCKPPGDVLGHELGHVLGGPAVEHSTSGLFMKAWTVGQHWVIDEASLAAVCELAPCTQFNPEPIPPQCETIVSVGAGHYTSSWGDCPEGE